MSPKTALIATVLFILWMLAMDQRRRNNLSAALWLPTIWALILGSRPVSNWFNLGAKLESADDYLEGSRFDRQLFLALITAGLLVLVKRRVNWMEWMRRNKWVAAYFIYFAISVLWSEYQYTAMKRWIKDFGNVVMALIIVTDAHVVDAFRAVLSRCLYVLVPMSVLLIRYYPELGRSYDRFTFEPYNQGVTLFKNQLGMAVAVCFVFLAWELLRSWRPLSGERRWLRLSGYAFLLLMSVWLLYAARSATSLVCAVLSCGTLVLIRLPFVRAKLDRLHWYIAFGGAAAYLAASLLDVGGLIFQFLGRDSSFTGRTDIWDLVLAEKINPLIGAGFYSFWTGERITKFWELYGVGMNQAHNGYLETYLIGGIIGVFLLLGVLISSGKAIQRRVLVQPEWGGLKLVFWLFAVVHNFTEASFSKVSLLWFVALTVIMESPVQEAVAQGKRGMAGSQARPRVRANVAQAPV